MSWPLDFDPRIAAPSDEARSRWLSARALYRADGATLDDLREAVTTGENTERIARRILGGAHPNVGSMEESLQQARATLRARETSSSA